jgi:hypothetical protein
MFTVATKTNGAAVQASFITSQSLRNQNHLQMFSVCEGVYNKGSRNTYPEKQQRFKNFILSTNAVAERLNDLAGGTQRQLKETVNILWRILLQLTRAQTVNLLHSFVLSRC